MARKCGCETSTPLIKCIAGRAGPAPQALTVAGGAHPTPRRDDSSRPLIPPPPRGKMLAQPVRHRETHTPTRGTAMPHGLPPCPRVTRPHVAAVVLLTAFAVVSPPAPSRAGGPVVLPNGLTLELVGVSTIPSR